MLEQYTSSAMQLTLLEISLKFCSIMSIHFISGTVQIHFDEWFSYILFTYSNDTFNNK